MVKRLAIFKAMGPAVFRRCRGNTAISRRVTSATHCIVNFRAAYGGAVITGELRVVQILAH